MKRKNLLAALLLVMAGVQTAVAQGFRVYQGDGTELQFSLKTDSIVFDNGLSGDEVFGPFTPVNQCVARTWYKTKSETSITLQPDGTKRLTATLYPSDADNRAVEWASSNSGVAQVINGLVVAVAKGGCVVTCSATDGSGVKAECQVTVTSGTTPDPGNHAWVDLGLPSGTLWATCNVGASKPEEYGDYFAWGETEPKSEYNWNTYKWCNGSDDTMTKYCPRSSNGYNGFTDGKTELEPTDDAATANWGSGWQMPSFDQIEELYNSSYTTTEWTQVNGVNGRKITSNSNGNSIFLPAAGYRWGGGLYGAGSFGICWSRSLSTVLSDYAYYLGFNSSDIDWDSYDRNRGFTVRAVRCP